MGQYDERARRLYLEGKTRKQAMSELGITNSNSMASLSNRIHLHWSWPLENRKNGIAPVGTKAPRAPRGNSRKSRSDTHEAAPSANNAVTPGAGTDTVATRTLLPPSSGFVSARERRLRGIVDTDGVGKSIAHYVSDQQDLEAVRYLESYYARQYG